MKIYPIRVRLANESYDTIIKIVKTSFKPEKEFNDEIFGWIDNMYVAMNKFDWENVNEIWREEDSWDLTIISQSDKGALGSAPNGDTQWLSINEWESYKNKNQ